DMATAHDLFCVPPPSSPPAAAGFNLSPDGLKLITVSRQTDGKPSGSCVVWDLTTQQRVAEFSIRSTAMAAAPVGALSPDGTRLATGVVGEPYTTYGVRLYGWSQRKALHTFIGHAGPVTALRFSADGQLRASGAQDTSVLVWDLIKLAAEK